MKRWLRLLLPSSWYYRLRLAWHRWNRSRFRARVVTHRFGDHTFSLHIADPLAQGWYDHDWEDPPEVRVLRGRRLLPGAKVFDLGAHQGIVALLLARAVGPGGSVVAVEVNPHNAAAAVRNCELNGVNWVTVVQAAVADRSGRISFNEGLNSRVADGSGEWGQFEVPAVTIDELAGQYGAPDVLLLDVEGSECQVLRGAPSTLANHPDWVVEVHSGAGLEWLGGTIEQVFSYFSPQDYQLSMIREGKPDSIPVTRPDDCPRERFWLVALGR